MPKNKSINLLPQEEFNVSTTGRVLRWATGTFRIIVIITEMIVMGAFLSRFWLDAQNSELNNSIKIKSAQIAAQSETENKFRSIQTKLNIFNEISQNRNVSQKIEGITSKLPANITLSGINISDTSARIRGVSEVDMQIAQFITNLQTDKSIKEVNIEQLTSSEGISMGTVFSINILYQ
jgi:Tfp pilus assembly protein PilN